MYRIFYYNGYDDIISKDIEANSYSQAKELFFLTFENSFGKIPRTYITISHFEELDNKQS